MALKGGVRIREIRVSPQSFPASTLEFLSCPEKFRTFSKPNAAYQTRRFHHLIEVRGHSQSSVLTVDLNQSDEFLSLFPWHRQKEMPNILLLNESTYRDPLRERKNEKPQEKNREKTKE